MATISIDVNGGTPATRRTVTKTVNATDLGRFVAAHRIKYGPGVDGQPLTDAETVDAWAADIFAQAVAYTREHELRTTAVAPIALT